MAQFATSQTESDIQITPECITQMTEAMFVSMLDIPVSLIAAADRPSPESGVLQASVEVSGDWQAELRVLASPTLASKIASEMFETPEDELEEDEVNDALGEVANVIGGNLKGIIGRECNLSIPVVQGTVEEIGQDAMHEAYNCCDGVLHVVLFAN